MGWVREESLPLGLQKFPPDRKNRRPPNFFCYIRWLMTPPDPVFRAGSDTEYLPVTDPDTLDLMQWGPDTDTRYFSK